MTDKKNKEEIQKAKNAAIKDEIPTKHLSWISFIIAFAFMIPTSLLLYPEIWVRMYFAIEIHSDTILILTGLVLAGALFIKIDHWLRNIARETTHRVRNSNQMSKKLSSSKETPDIYDVKLDVPKFKFQRRDRDFSPNKQAGQYRHESMIKDDDMRSIDGIMPHLGSSDGPSGHVSGGRYGGAKRSGRR